MSVENGRNPGMPLDMGWVRATTVNRSATQRRVSSLVARRSVKKSLAGGPGCCALSP